MRTKRNLVGLMVWVALLFSWSPAWSGGEGSAPPNVEGPEVWGVIVMDCTNPSAIHGTFRVKAIDNCNVQTEAFAGTWPTCPESATDPLGVDLAGPIAGIANPVITRVKNFHVQGDIVSFDAQIRNSP